MKTFFSLFARCFVLVALCFGGGYAMIPLIEREFVEKHADITREDMADIVVLGQSLPGIISGNILIMIGYKRLGLLGVLAVLLAIMIPCVTIIALVTLAYTAVIENEIVQAVMIGVRAGVAALILSAAVKMLKNSVKDVFCIVLVVFCALALLVKLLGFAEWLNPVYLVLFGAGAGFTASLIGRKRGKGRTAAAEDSAETDSAETDGTETDSAETDGTDAGGQEDA